MQIVEPNKKSDAIAQNVLKWLGGQRNGVVNGLMVSAGTSGFKIDVGFGEVFIDGTHVHDDEDHADSMAIENEIGTGALSSDTHVRVYLEYNYTDTFPPAAMIIGAVATGEPGAHQVKIADIFIEVGETDLSNARIVQAERMMIKRTAADVVFEKLIYSNANVIVNGGGSIRYDTEELIIPADIYVYAPVITDNEQFMSAPMVQGKIAAATISMSSNSFVFTKLNRRVPMDMTAAAPALGVYSIDFGDANQGNAGATAFYDALTRDQIVMLGMIISGNFIPKGQDLGSSVPAPSAGTNMFLQMEASGNHFWGNVYDYMILAGLSITIFEPDFNTYSDGSGVVELGDVLDAGGGGGNIEAFFHAITTSPPDSATITNVTDAEPPESVDFAGTSQAEDIFLPPSSGTLQISTTGANGQKQFRLDVSDSGTNDNSLGYIHWYRFTHFGVGTVDPTDSATIQALASKHLRSGRGITIDLNPSDEHIYFAYPAWKGDVVKIVDELTGFVVTDAYTKTATISVETINAAAIAENYYLYKSNQLLDGHARITVS